MSEFRGGAVCPGSNTAYPKFTAVDLDAVHKRISDWPGVTLEFEPESLGGGPTRHMMCSIPGDIRVEFIAPVAG